MKRYLCKQIYDNHYNKVTDVAGTIAIGILGGMRDRDAEKYKIYISEETGKLQLIGIGLSAWGQIEEEKEQTEYNISEFLYQVDDYKIRIELPKRVREFEILKMID